MYFKVNPSPHEVFMFSGQEDSKVGRPLPNAADAVAEAAASVKIVADKANEMLSNLEGSFLWKLITGSKP